MQNKTKFSVAILFSSIALIGGLKVKEGYTSYPVIPTKGDVPTYGHGTTVRPDGTKVKMTDKPINRETADYYLRHHVSQVEKQFRTSIPGVKLSQSEFDLYVDFLYQYGITTWNKSSVRSNLQKGNYVQACNSLLKYKYVAGRDCSIRSNNCYGVWTRQVERHAKCMGAQ